MVVNYGHNNSIVSFEFANRAQWGYQYTIEMIRDASLESLLITLMRNKIGGVKNCEWVSTFICVLCHPIYSQHLHLFHCTQNADGWNNLTGKALKVNP